MRPILLVILVILGKAKDLLGQEKVCPKHTPPETHFLNIHVAVLYATRFLSKSSLEHADPEDLAA